MTSGKNGKNLPPKNLAPEKRKSAGAGSVGRAEKDKDPFKEMGFIKFWVVSTIFCLSFPISLLVCLLTLGEVRTKQLVAAIIKDYLLTLLILVGLAALAIWFVYDYVSGWFA